MMDDNLGLTAILRTLNKCDYQRDVVAIRNLTYEILTLSTNGSNIKPALPTVVKLLAHPDAFVKRVTGEIIAIHAEESQDISLLGINTLVQDCKDVNPVVRGVSFRILGSIKANAVSEVLNKSIIDGLADKNGYVRRSAALASISLNQLSSSAVLDGEIWDLLYHHLRDDDAATVASCLCALEEVCTEEKGIIMSNKLGQYLIKNMHTFSPTVQRVVLQFLLKFTPKTKDQMFDHLNYLDDNLSKAQCFAMALSAYELFQHFTQNVPKASKKLTSSAWSSIKNNMARERDEEMISAVIHYIISVNFSVENCSADFVKFLCRDDDSVFLTHHKIRILSKMITSDNANKIFSQCLSSIRTMSLKDVKYLVHNVSEILNEKPDVSKSCVDFLKNMMATDKPEIINEVIEVLPYLRLSEDNQWKEVLTLMEEKWDLVTSQEAKIAILQMIKSHASIMDNAASIVEEMVLDLDQCYSEFSEEDERMKKGNGVDPYSPVFKTQLLGAVVQVFLLRPAYLHPILSRLMEYCIKDCDYYVKDKALTYYGFLMSRVETTILV